MTGWSWLLAVLELELLSMLERLPLSWFWLLTSMLAVTAVMLFSWVDKSEEEYEERMFLWLLSSSRLVARDGSCGNW